MSKPKKHARRIERRGRITCEDVKTQTGHQWVCTRRVARGKTRRRTETRRGESPFLVIRVTGRTATTWHRGPRWAVLQSSLGCGVESMTSCARRLWSRPRRGQRWWTGRQTDVSVARRTDKDEDVLKLRRHRQMRSCGQQSCRRRGLALAHTIFDLCPRFVLESTAFEPEKCCCL